MDKAFPRGNGRPKLDDESSALLTAAKQIAADIKHSTYALGKTPENLTNIQKIRLEMIAQQNPRCIVPAESRNLCACF